MEVVGAHFIDRLLDDEKDSPRRVDSGAVDVATPRLMRQCEHGDVEATRLAARCRQFDESRPVTVTSPLGQACLPAQRRAAVDRLKKISK